MPLFNAEGFVLFGPGSEWFWSMLQFVIVAVTLLGIYSQLRLSRSASIFAQVEALEREWNAEPLTRKRLAVYLALRDGTPSEDLPPAHNSVASFWERAGSLARAGHIDLKVLREQSGLNCEIWWAILAPRLLAYRAAHRDPSLWEHFEWTAAAMDRLTREAGAEPYIDAAWVERELEWLIAGVTDNLSDLEAMRSIRLLPAEPGSTDATRVGDGASDGGAPIRDVTHAEPGLSPT